MNVKLNLIPCIVACELRFKKNIYIYVIFSLGMEKPISDTPKIKQKAIENAWFSKDEILISDFIWQETPGLLKL